MNKKSICRCCLSRDGVEPIFYKTNVEDCQEMSYSEMLTALTSNVVYSADGLPRQMCLDCCRELKQAYAFRIKCDKSYEMLMLWRASEGALDIPECETSDEDCNNNGESNNEVDNKNESKMEAIQGNGFVSADPLLDSDSDLDPTGDLRVDYDSLKYYIKLEAGPDTPEEEVYGSAGQTASSVAEHSCPVCADKFKLESNLLIHIKMIHPGYKPDCYFCVLCDKSYKDGFKHIKLRHTDKKQYNCYICEKKFPTYSELGDHLEEHKVHGYFQCKDCPMKYTVIKYYNNHVKIHRKATYLCHVCAKMCVKRVYLLRHIIQCHTTERKYFCDYCSKGFTAKNNLLLHIRTHTREKPFLCDLCPMKFKCLYYLQKHKRRHDKYQTTSLTCPVCNITFKTMKAYGAHMATRRNEKIKNPCSLQLVAQAEITTREYPCRHCGKMFYRVDSRHMHEKRMVCMKQSETQTEINEYPCRRCGKMFLKSYVRNRHERKVPCTNNAKELDQ